MSTPEEITKALMEPFPATAYKPRPDNKRLTYLEGVTVFRRLISATNNNFTIEVLKEEETPFGSTKTGADNRILLRATVRLTIPGLGSREHVGVQVVNATSGGEDLWKGAITDGIKKAATLFGVNLDNYGPDYEANDYDPGQQPVAPTGGTASRVPTPPPATGSRTPQPPPQASQPAPASRVPQRPTTGSADPVVSTPDPPAQPRAGRRVPPPPTERAGVIADRLDQVSDAELAQMAQDSVVADKDGVLLPATEQQRNYMRGLYKGLGYVDDDGHTDMVSLDGFLKRDYNATWDTLTKEEASSVISDLIAAQELGTETNF